MPLKAIQQSGTVLIWNQKCVFYSPANRANKKNMEINLEKKIWKKNMKKKYEKRNVNAVRWIVCEKLVGEQHGKVGSLDICNILRNSCRIFMSHFDMSNGFLAMKHSPRLLVFKLKHIWAIKKEKKKYKNTIQERLVYLTVGIKSTCLFFLNFLNLENCTCSCIYTWG